MDIFLIAVFLVQLAIAVLNFLIARKHYDVGMYSATYIDILCGISWTMTGMYKLCEGLHLI